MLEQQHALASDQELLEACRGGDNAAFGELWGRHRTAARTAARSLGPSLDADDLVSESYLRILELVSRGKGPSGAFRPYLYQVIRSVAADTLKVPEVSVAEFDATPAADEDAPWQEKSFDIQATARAFSALPERWQSVLWYTVVEGMSPRHVAPLLGVTANAVSVLALRAREGLQSAWVEQHVDMSRADQGCQETLERLQRYQRGKLTARFSRSVRAHLDGCESCSAVADEVAALNSQLALVLSVALLGTSAGTLLAAAGFGAPGSAAPTAAGADASGTTSSGSASAAAATGAAAGGMSMAIGIGAALAVTLALAAGGTIFVTSLNNSRVEVPVEAPKPTQTPPPIASNDEEEPKDEQIETPQPEESSELSQGTVRVAQPVRKPNPDTSEENDPKTPPPGSVKGLDPSLTAGFECYLTDPDDPESFLITGTANAYGVIQVRIWDGLLSSTDLLAPQFDPKNPSSLFVDGVFDDGRGNRFTEGFFTGTDDAPDHWWWSPTSLTPLSQWGSHLDGKSIDDVIVLVRLLKADGSYSPWSPIESPELCF